MRFHSLSLSLFLSSLHLSHAFNGWLAKENPFPLSCIFSSFSSLILCTCTQLIHGQRGETSDAGDVQAAAAAAGDVDGHGGGGGGGLCEELDMHPLILWLFRA